ncbi:flagellar hook-length control protein FliK [Teredinibacter purpureus]|uniref:flagellar hook-length control protein FliK n=1 Tax=Teredinibacter purpureus TaxID=2731756 RepID=UPI0005F85862|nr:flagellar hook-length control protein FliK [Teredinibacter purpureus]
MEIPPINTPTGTQGSIRSRSTPTNSTASLVKLVNATPNQTVNVTVEQQTVVTVEQRQALIKSLTTPPSPASSSTAGKNDSTQHPNQNPTPIATARPTVSKALLQLLEASPSLHFLRVKLQPTANNSTLPKTFTLLSPVSLSISSAVNIQVRADGNAQLLQGAHNTPTSQLTAKADTQTSDLFKSARDYVIKNAPTANIERQSPTVESRQTTSTLQTLQHALRLHMPYQQPLKNSVTTINTLHKALNTLPSALKTHVVNPNLLNAVTRLTQPNIQSASQLSPQNIKHIIQQSGPYLENNIRANMDKPTQSLTNSTSALPFKYDTKNLLLQIFTEASKSSPEPLPTNRPDPASTTLQHTLSRAATLLREFSPLIDTLKQLTTNAAVAPKQSLELKTQIARILTAASAIGLANISANQIRQLLNRSTDVNTGPVMLEFSLKLQEHIIPVSLQLTPYYATPEQESDTPPPNNAAKKQKAQRWTLFMTLELDDYGPLATEITLTGNRITTRFWSEHEDVRSRTAARLTALKALLEEKGLDVEDLRLEAGKPPTMAMPIKQTLIDIRT